MSPDLSELRLDDTKLQEIRNALRDRIAEGLQSGGGEIKCLPGHLPPPPEGLTGEAIVVDTGGTNMRAAVVSVGADSRIEAGPIQKRLPARERQMDAEAFFDVQADLVAELAPDRELPLGYCFSYPSAVEPSRDARLIRWTKGIDVPGVEGALVGTGLVEALGRRGFHPRRFAVLNDTVASMLGGAVVLGGTSRSQIIGLIAGTGSNMSAFLSAPRFSGSGVMAVNLESGNFNPPHLTSWDRAVDAASDNPGAQRFEKAIAGHYLPYIFGQILDVEGFDPEAGTGVLVGFRDDDTLGDPATVAEALLSRAADMVAAGLAAVADFYEGDVSIVAEGSLFWRDPKFADRCRSTLTRMTTQDVEIFRVPDANLIGSAVAALCP